MSRQIDPEQGIYERVRNRTRRYKTVARGMVAARHRALPDFLLIGTQRGGTTALFSYLMAHPSVKRPIRKEIHFFDRFYPLGSSWYRAHFPFEEADRTWITGEATADYLFVAEAPVRARRLLPNARIIVLLRDPVERAHSAWKLKTRQGRERRSFEEAVHQELAGMERSKALAPFVRLPKAYLARGEYAAQLRRWTAEFGSECLLVLFSDELKEEPAATYRTVLDFLELPMFDEVDFVFRHGTGESEVDPYLRDHLAAYYDESRRRLATLLGRELPW